MKLTAAIFCLLILIANSCVVLFAWSSPSANTLAKLADEQLTIASGMTAEK